MKLLRSSVSIFLLFCFASVAQASTGAVDTVSRFSWSDTGGWTNWGTADSSVVVSDTRLSGYIWSANFGWINLAPSLGGVLNDGQGVLSGYAWGESIGWIDFSGVSIDTNGLFHGHTVAQNIFGTMTFDCTNCSVITTWRKSAPIVSGGGGGGGGVLSGPLSVGYQTYPGPTSTVATTTTSATVPTSPKKKTSISGFTTTVPSLVPKTKPSLTVQPLQPPTPNSTTTGYTYTPTFQAVPAVTALSTTTPPVSTTRAYVEASTTPDVPAPAPSCSSFWSCVWQAIKTFLLFIVGYFLR